MHVDDTGVRLDGEVVAWDSLVAVAIRTTDLGPFSDDFHWVLARRDGPPVVIASETEGAEALLPALQRLPGFDDEAVIRASASTENALFPCWRRRVTLRTERQGRDYRHLEAYVDVEGALHVDGHDLGPGTAMVSDDGEYEWFQTIAAADVPRLVELLGGAPGEHVLDVLERGWTGPRSYDLEALLRKGDIPVERVVWSG